MIRQIRVKDLEFGAERKEITPSLSAFGQVGEIKKIYNFLL